MPAATDPSASAAVHYCIAPADLHAHLFTVTLSVAAPQAAQEFALPVWIPGSYLVREFSKNLQRLQAQQGDTPVPLTQLDKHRWRATCRSGAPLTLRYEVCAYDPSVRAAWLDAARGFFNGTSLCLRVVGQEAAVHTLEVLRAAAPPDWRLATALAPVQVDAAGFGVYRAGDYDELVDSPVEMGDFWSGAFTACGVPHRFVVSGAAPAFDGERLLADTQKICAAAIRLWHGEAAPPHTHYLFMLHAMHDGYGGLEHRHSTALVCSRRALPRRCDALAAPAAQADQTAKPSEDYTRLLGLISHEYFHTWNVKRLRPAEFARYDYDRENYTELLWFFEGFTSYYDDLLLRRAGLIDDAAYLKQLTQTIHQVTQAPGRSVQSVAQASFDAWIKYYRPDENTPNATVSYYAKGALVALCLDLTLRREGRTTLDAVLRALWQRCAGGPMREDDLRAVLAELGGRSFAPELDAWVHGTDELPLAELLAAHGVRMQAETPQIAQRLGLRVSENHSVQIKTVLRHGAAEQAGMAAGDEWLGVEVQGQGWRLARLDELPLLAGAARELTALVARDGRLLRLPLGLPDGSGAPPDTFRLSVADGAALGRWLGSPL
ncbi:M61 family metallopeptidase [Extensimonas vulgaris]|uniref:Putative metalloprotease with PDZ domain n=1 Tax=Extensimonas vulgaris TaxID=1031594 RepID=A0A369AU98_9BURK|nr:M61 family metallopeptidase [Extensimonas vulgaris]RCX11034.1 putative metalloprotease with PDZ domain [Extensimonas vulgaris]TWI41708.1 putative metalloprotease with PDZ domain [Extensimonas vulgaris]TXD16173.1 M61 family metallopeptidase [Extensimonas vulgaris]